MYKRKDWLFTHGKDGKESSSDESSDGDSGEVEGRQEAVTSGDGSSSGADTGSPLGSSSEGGEDEEESKDEGAAGMDPFARLEDLSEDDFERDSDDEELQALKQNWLEAPKEDLVKGRALKCKLCLSALILNSASLKHHLHPKAHMRRVKEEGTDDAADPICFAEQLSMEAQGEVETHTERLQRISQQLQTKPGKKLEPSAPVEAESYLQAAVEDPKAHKRKLKQRSKPRPNKRQRAQLRQEQEQQGVAAKTGQQRRRQKGSAEGANRKQRRAQLQKPTD